LLLLAYLTLLLFLLLLACLTLTLFNTIVILIAPCLLNIDIARHYCFSCYSLLAGCYLTLLLFLFLFLT
jgi:hypothetical protein